MAASAQGKHLVVVNQDIGPDSPINIIGIRKSEATSLRFSLFSLPRSLLRSWVWSGNEPLCIGSMRLSPDGRTLAVALLCKGRPLYLFNAHRQGHRSASGTFLPDRGSHLPGRRPIATDPAMPMGLCAGGTIGSGRSPPLSPCHVRGHASCPPVGKYLLGQFHDPEEEQDPQPAVVDCDSGGRMCFFPDLSLAGGQVAWLDDSRAVWVEEERLVRLDCRQGKVLRRCRSTSTRLARGLSSRPGVMVSRR